jgi:tRNA (Thr-GGU) A37 N-methylase
MMTGKIKSNTEKITFNPIGIIRSPHKRPSGTPIQPSAAGDVGGVGAFF